MERCQQGIPPGLSLPISDACRWIVIPRCGVEEPFSMARRLCMALRNGLPLLLRGLRGKGIGNCCSTQNP